MSTEKERIEKIMMVKDLTSTQLATEIGVNSSNISHIINGRNNPSLEIIKKILERFPEVNPEWLIFGQEPMFRQKMHSRSPSLFDVEEVSVKESDDYPIVHAMKKEPEIQTIRGKEQFASEIPTGQIEKEIISSKRIERLIVYFSDNTFQEFHAE